MQIEVRLYAQKNGVKKLLIYAKELYEIPGHPISKLAIINTAYEGELELKCVNPNETIILQADKYPESSSVSLFPKPEKIYVVPQNTRPKLKMVIQYD